MNEPFRTDGESPAEFADAGSEAALAELMARHGSMVHVHATRTLRNQWIDHLDAAVVLSRVEIL